MNGVMKVPIAIAILALFVASGCTSTATKHDLTVNSKNLDTSSSAQEASASKEDVASAMQGNSCLRYFVLSDELKTSQAEVYGVTRLLINICTGEVKVLGTDQSTVPGVWPSIFVPLGQSVIGAGGQVWAADKLGDSRVKAAKEFGDSKVEAAEILSESEGGGLNLSILNQGPQAKAGANATSKQSSSSEPVFVYGDGSSDGDQGNE